MTKGRLRRIGSILLLATFPLLGGWSPPAPVLDQPILIPAEGGGDYDTGMTLRQFAGACRRLFGSGKAEFMATSRARFTMRCVFKNQRTGQVFSNVSEFTPTILGHHDALKLERFHGPDGTAFTPAQLKEHFERLEKSQIEPRSSPSPQMLDAAIHLEFRKDDLRNVGFTPRDIAVGCIQWQSGAVTYQMLNDRALPAFALTCTVERGKQLYFNQQSFLFAVPLSSSNQSIVFLMGISNKSTSNGEVRSLNSDQTVALIKSIRDRLLGDGKAGHLEEGRDPFSPNFQRCNKSHSSNCAP